MEATRVLLKDLIAGAAVPLTGAAADYDALLEMVGDSPFVLLGEASHGTHEFYRERAQITKRLITERGFTAVAVEADWPDAYRVIDTCAGRAETARPWTRSPDSNASRHGDFDRARRMSNDR